MGYSIRTPDARYTEWVLMTYTAEGAHRPNWNVRCSREYYNTTADTVEQFNLAESAAAAPLVRAMSRRLHAGWRVAAGAGEWPANLPTYNQTALSSCPMSEWTPNPSPPHPVTPCVSGSIVKGRSRHCTNVQEQANASDTRCWCAPAHVPINATSMRTYTDCQTLCANDALCKAWTFASGTGCFRHSTDATYTAPAPQPGVWSGCEHYSAEERAAVQQRTQQHRELNVANQAAAENGA